MKVVVIGGTGFIGTNLCCELVERGHEVTALSRTPGDADLPAGVETVAGDVTDRGSIDAAFEGQDAAINLVALSAVYKPRGGKTHEEVHLGGTRNVVAAAEEHGLRKLVQMSALGADPDGPTAYIRAKGRAEAVVRSSNLSWTIVRPSLIFGEGEEFLPFVRLLTTPYVTALPGGGRTRFQPLWIGDMVSILADCLDEAHDGEVYEIGGPDVLTMADVTRLIYRADGRPTRILSVPMVLARLALMVAEPIPFVPFGTDQYRSLEFDNTVTANDVVAFGIDPAEMTSLESYLGLES